jgi:gliding motility-associated-like protein
MRRLVRIFTILLICFIPFLSEAQLTAGFTVNNSTGCTPLLSQFHDATTGGTVSSYQWYYILHGTTDTVGSATSSSPVFAFTDTGYYDIVETVTSSSGSATFYGTDSVHAFQSNVSFTATTASDTMLSCAGKTITFHNTTTNIGCPAEFVWYFVNTATGVETYSAITTGTAATVTYTFNTPGYYNVSLFETTPCNCSGHAIYDSFVKIEFPPTACISSAPDTNGCKPPETANFNSSCTAGAASYLWLFGDGATSTLADPAHTYTSSGTFNPSLIAYSSAGCADTVHFTGGVRVGRFIPGIKIISSPPFCAAMSAPTYLAIHDTTFGATNWYWSNNLDGDHSAIKTPVFGVTPGIYVFADSVSDTLTGCSGVAFDTVTVYSNPIINITAAPTYRCVPNDTVTFSASITDTSGIAQYKWAFGVSHGPDDSAYTSTAVHIYTASGSYSDTLWAKDNVGCSSYSYVNNLVNIEPPLVTITPTFDSGCAPDTICYTSSINHAGATFITDTVYFGDGSMCIGNGCGDTCHVYTTGGTFKIKQFYHLPAGCYYSDSAYVTIGTIHPIFSPVASAYSVCPNSEVYFSADCSNCTSFFWNLSNKTSVHTYDSTKYGAQGVENIIAIGDVNGCTDTIPLSIVVYPPAANIYATVPHCDSNNVIHFSSAGSYGATRFHWSFGDGTFSTLTNPVHTYTVPTSGNTYEVVMVDTNTTHMCTNIDSIPVNIYPFIDTFSANDTAVCRLVNVTFTGPIPQTGGFYSKYIWTFSSTATAPVTMMVYGSNVISYAFTDTGIYNVRLIVQNAYNCTDTAIKLGYIHVTGPIGGFTASPLIGCVPSLVNFHDNNTVVAGATITSRQWQFSGPGMVAGVPATLDHGYSSDTSFTYPEGSFRVVLIDSDNNHCFSYDSIRIRSVKPHAYFTANTITNCIGKPITFTDTNTNCTYHWDFGDGDTATGRVVMHSYSANGTYSVAVSIRTTASSYLPSDCVDTFKRISYIMIGPINVGFNFLGGVSSTICPPLDVAANATGIVPGYSYYWDINNIAPYFAGTSFSHVFNTAGIYNVTLIDSNAAGCKDSVSQTVEIDGPAGIIVATPDSGCVPLSVSFHFTDTNGTAVVPNFTWITGDTIYNFVDTPGVSHIYRTPGTYYASVIITSAGCSVTINSIDTVNVFPIPDVTVTHPGIICFGADTTLIASGATPGSTYTWLPAYGLSCTSCAAPVANPTVSTTYSVVLTSIHGCSDTTSTTVMVDSQLTLHVAGLDSICLGKPDTLYAYGVAGNYLWTPETGVSSVTSDTVIVFSIASRNYTVTATDNKGCSAAAYFDLTINPLPLISVSPANPYVCFGSSTQLIASGAGAGGTYVWSPDHFINDTTVYNPIVSDTADFVYKVVATTALGCVDSDVSVSVTVYDSAITTISNDTVICRGKSAQLAATSSSGNMATYLWSPSAGLSDPTSARPLATPDTTTVYSVFIQENPCFSATRSVKVTVVPDPEIILPATTTIIAGSSIQLTALVGNSAEVSMWAWVPAGTLSCDNCYNPVATPTANTTYTVTGTTPIGCMSDATVTVNIICAESSQVFVPNTFTPNGDGANDRFFLSGKGLGLITRMSVYNRWGEEVFTAENINPNDAGAGWDGTYKGQVLQPDVFVYVIELTCETGVPFKLTGDISLVR